MYYRLCHLWFALIVFAGHGCGNEGSLSDGRDARGRVHVTVLDPWGYGGLLDDAKVMFVDPDGTLVKLTGTDGAGQAEADVLPGASVTSIWNSGGGVWQSEGEYYLETVLAVKPGDHLVLGSRRVDESIAGHLTISYPEYPGAIEYEVAYPCGNTRPVKGTSVTVPIRKWCDQDTMELAVIASSRESRASIATAGLPFMAGDSVEITGSYQELRSFTASYANISPWITSIQMTRGIPDIWGFTDSHMDSSPRTTETFAVHGPQGTTSEVLSEVEASGGSHQIVRQRISGTAANYDLDLSATLLPWLKKPQVDPARGKLILPIDTTGTSSDKPDFFKIMLYINRPEEIIGWRILGPEPGEIALPALPPELAHLAPAVGDLIVINQAWLFEADSVGYDELHQDLSRIADLETRDRWAATAPWAGTAGATTVRVSVAPTD